MDKEIGQTDLSLSDNFSLEELQRKTYANSKQHGFWDISNNDIVYKLMLIASEIFELFESYREGKLISLCDKETQPLLSNIEEELADIIIRVADLSQHYNINLAKIIKIKHNFNINRPHMHGGKLL